MASSEARPPALQDHVGVADLEAERLFGMDARIHAGQHGKVVGGRHGLVAMAELAREILVAVDEALDHAHGAPPSLVANPTDWVGFWLREARSHRRRDRPLAVARGRGRLGSDEIVLGGPSYARSRLAPNHRDPCSPPSLIHEAPGPTYRTRKA